MTPIPLVSHNLQCNNVLRKADFHLTKPVPQLNDNILCKIFQYFSCTELLNLSMVSSQWSDVIQNMPKLARFTVHDTLPEIVSLLHEFPQSLRQLELYGLDGNISTVLRKVRILQKNLQHIHIDSCAVIKECSQKSGRRMDNFLKNCPELQTVRLVNLNFDMKPTLETFAQMQNLRSLTVGNNPCINSTDLLTLILNCDHLQSLYLYRISCLCDQDIRFIFGLGGRLCEQLKELTLDRVDDLGPSAYDCILNCKQLHALRINYSTGLSPQTLTRLPDELRLLRRLQLERVCRIRSVDLEQLFTDAAAKKMQLSEFGLIDCCTRMNDDALRALAGSQSQSLVRLQLRDCVGLRDVSCLFEQFRHLREIDLSGCVALHQPLSFSSETLDITSENNRNIANRNSSRAEMALSSMSKIVLPRHLKNPFETVLKSHLLYCVMYDKQVRREEEMHEVDYSKPVCIKF